MALLPKCELGLELPERSLIPGEPAGATLVIRAEQAIPRAVCAKLDLTTRAVIEWREGGRARTTTSVLYHHGVMFPIPANELSAGLHRFPFTVTMPEWVPPAYTGNGCSISHSFKARLDVNWARDPKAVGAVRVALRPVRATRIGCCVRSPEGFHDDFVIELALDATMVVEGEMLHGSVALRAGHSASFEFVRVSLESRDLAVELGETLKRRGPLVVVRPDALRAGKHVPFALRVEPWLSPPFVTEALRHSTVLVVTLVLSWGRERDFATSVRILPRGSVLDGATGLAVVGDARVRALAEAMAAATGLQTGASSTLIATAVGAGPVALSIDDAPRHGRLGVDVRLSFPSVAMGLVLRPRTVLDAVRRDAGLTPATLAGSHVLECTPHVGQPPLPPEAREQLIATLFDAIEGASDVSLRDDALAYHRDIESRDESSHFVAAALGAQAKAKAIEGAIRALPFPAAWASHEPSWRAAESEWSAFLVPSGPSLHGIKLGVRVLGGGSRELIAAVRTVWSDDGPTTVVDADLGEVTISDEAWTELAGDSTNEHLRAVRTQLPRARVDGDRRHVTLSRDGFQGDPRRVVNAVESLLAWVIDVRGERVADAPYR